MNIETKKASLVQLGQFFHNCVKSYDNTGYSLDGITLKEDVLLAVSLIDSVRQENGWFTKDSVRSVFEAWANSLTEQNVEKWMAEYNFTAARNKKVGVIMAGNLPLVGLHDALSVFVSGNRLHAKISTKDKSLMTLVLSVLKKVSGETESILLVEQLKDIDILIATGSDNSARYFNYYFKDKKRIIRKNRTSIAVLNGQETEEELHGLSHDIFQHFGLGCRNVTKLYLPIGYDLDTVFKAVFHYKEIGYHNKYANNYDYNKAVYLLNQVELIENGFVLFKEDEGLHSPVGVLFYEFYEDLDSIESKIEANEESLQCVVTNESLNGQVPFGKAQSPELWDYADGIDTVQFLLEA